MDIKQKLIAYDDWANKKVFAAVSSIKDDKAKHKAAYLLQHLLAAQKVWHNRITGNGTKVQVWDDEPNMETIENWMREAPAIMQSIADRENQSIRYSNSRGDQFSNSVEEMFHHLIIHGQHHRAQIATILREQGLTPPPTDFIFYMRDQNK